MLQFRRRPAFAVSLSIWGAGVLCGLGAAMAMARWDDGSGVPVFALLLVGIAAVGAVLAGLPRRCLRRRRAVVWQEPAW